jgi:hypothetical protein
MIRVSFVPPAKALFNFSINSEILACPIQAILPLQVVPGMVYKLDQPFLSEVVCNVVGTLFVVLMADPIGSPFYMGW